MYVYIYIYRERDRYTYVDILQVHLDPRVLALAHREHLGRVPGPVRERLQEHALE